MSADFDPLHRWLGIPPEEQPPNHYRLLGLRAFEDIPEVIEAAADQRTAYVRQLAMGKYADYSQKILNGLSAARICLLNPAQTLEYDRQLRSKLDRPAASLDSPDEPARGLPFPATGPVAKTPIGAPPGNGANSPILIYGAVIFVAVISVVGVLFTLSGQKPEPPKVVQKPPPAAPGVTPNKPPPVAPPISAPVAPLPAANPFKPVVDPRPETKPALAPPITIEVKPQVTIPPLKFDKAKTLLVIGPDAEFDVAVTAGRRYGINCERAQFNESREDYDDHHAIYVGSNAMDFWGGTPERNQPEAFSPIENWVKGGGHLIVMGAFNGRNMEHLQRFGIQTGFYHCSKFKPVTGNTDLLFEENEEVVPRDFHLQSVGNFTVKGPHAVLLDRAETNAPGPALATLTSGKGRVTISVVEPFWQNDEWLVTVLVGWIARGSPVERASSNP